MRKQKSVARLDRGEPINKLLVRYRYVLFLILGFSLIASVGYGLAHRPHPIVLAVLPPQPTPLPTSSPTPAPVSFHIVGPVQAPGVYTLPPGAQIQDAIQIAGGPTIDADLELLNLAVPVEDHQQIIVPQRSDTEMPGSYDVLKDNAVDPVNINSADSEILQTLPGIGPVLAERIIEYRQDHGAFAAIDELANVSGIGEAKLEKIRDLITIGP